MKVIIFTEVELAMVLFLLGKELGMFEVTDYNASEEGEQLINNITKKLVDAQNQVQN